MSIAGAVCYGVVVDWAERCMQECKQELSSPFTLAPDARAYVQGRISAFEEMIDRFKGEE